MQSKVSKWGVTEGLEPLLDILHPLKILLKSCVGFKGELVFRKVWSHQGAALKEASLKRKRG